MKRTTYSCILRGMAISALTNMAMPVAEAWAADEVQVLRRSAPNAQAAGGVMPFTTFQQEELALTASVPCKWISKDGRLGPSYGGGRYDFLCKGGDFATVSLYLDKAVSPADGVGKARLLYRDWPVNTNPNAGEAVVAQGFLAHVTGRFVPAAIAGEVMDAFWANKSRKWTQNGVTISFEVDKGPQFSVRRLEIAGTGAALNRQIVPMVQVLPQNTGLTKADTKVFVYGKDGEPLQAPDRVLPGVAVTTGMPARVPTDAGLTKPTALNPINTVNVPTQINFTKEPTVVVPLPTGVLPVPGTGGFVRPVGELVIPGNAPASSPQVDEGAAPLQQATPAELNTAPAPESKVVPVAPTELSATLVPSTADLVGGRQRAPSNFEAYNRAVELTKDLEDKAQIAKVEQAKVTASKRVSGTAYVTPSTIAVPPLKAVPTPEMNKPVEAAPATPAAVTGEGLGVKTSPALDEAPLPTNYNGPRSTEPRPLPQLKFVPKAEPLRKADDVIQFEDEKSRL